MSWFDELQGAKFGGVPFGVLGGQIRVGRRNAVHEYPFKDEVWVEDLGRAARRITLTGFLVESAVYGGLDSVIQQRDQMIAVCESAGQSTLVHPTLGSLKVSLLESVFTERWDRGRVFEIGFSFIESGERVFPENQEDTSKAVEDACDGVDIAALTDFSLESVTALAFGSSVVDMAVSTAGGWASGALAQVSDATNLMNMVGDLPGDFGRFFGGRARGITGAIAGSISGVTSLSGLIAAGTAARSLVSDAVSTLLSAATGLSISTIITFAQSAQSLVATVLAATTDPADGVRVLSTLANFTPTVPTDSSATGIARAAIQTASGDLFRRAAVTSVCRASSTYQPASYDDAVTVRSQVTTLLDAEIQVAGNSGADASYNALRSLRAAVVKDLTARGADLAALITISSRLPLPAPVLAQRVYRDSSRSDELVVEADCVHPAFMPTAFKGLAT